MHEEVAAEKSRLLGEVGEPVAQIARQQPGGALALVLHTRAQERQPLQLGGFVRGELLAEC